MSGSVDNQKAGSPRQCTGNQSSGAGKSNYGRQIGGKRDIQEEKGKDLYLVKNRTQDKEKIQAGWH